MTKDIVPANNEWSEIVQTTALETSEQIIQVLLCSECGKETEAGNRIEFYRSNDAAITKVQHQACADQLELVEFASTGRLTSSLIMRAGLCTISTRALTYNSYININEAYNRLHQDVKRFESEVWFGGVEPVGETIGLDNRFFFHLRTSLSLQSIVEDSQYRTLEAKCGDITVTGQTMAGRVLIELEDPAARITLITAEREQLSRMGIQGIDGTEERCRRMIDVVRTNWRTLTFVEFNFRLKKEIL